MTPFFVKLILRKYLPLITIGKDMYHLNSRGIFCLTLSLLHKRIELQEKGPIELGSDRKYVQLVG